MLGWAVTPTNLERRWPNGPAMTRRLWTIIPTRRSRRCPISPNPQSRRCPTVLTLARPMRPVDPCQHVPAIRRIRIQHIPTSLNPTSLTLTLPAPTLHAPPLSTPNPPALSPLSHAWLSPNAPASAPLPLTLLSPSQLRIGRPSRKALFEEALEIGALVSQHLIVGVADSHLERGRGGAGHKGWTAAEEEAAQVKEAGRQVRYAFWGEGGDQAGGGQVWLKALNVGWALNVG